MIRRGTQALANTSEQSVMETKPIYIIGDVHGEWNSLIYKIKDAEITDATLICVGDLGVGFSSDTITQRTLQRLNEFFKQRSIQFLSIRGNHDDPSYFDGQTQMSNLVLVPDYSVEIISSLRFGFVGGAISIDRTERINRDSYRWDSNVSYWRDEICNYHADKIRDVDVLITHTAPLWNGPINKDALHYWTSRDPGLWNQLVEERKMMSAIVQQYGAKHHYCGHFHLHSIAEHDGCTSRILDILEIVEHKI